MTIGKFMLITVAGLILCNSAFAQDDAKPSKYELSIFAAGGLSALKFDVTDGDAKAGAGGSFGAGLYYSVSDRWSVGSGLELSLYSSKAALNTVSDRYAANDGEYNFEFRTAISGYEENQNAMYLTVPLLARFQIPVIGESRFYVAGGFKFGIPVSAGGKVTKAVLQNSGYYPVWSGGSELVLDTQNFMGFGTFEQRNVDRNLDLKAAFFVSLESGIRFKTGKTTALYAGAYLDWGLNDVRSNPVKRLVEYSSTHPAEFTHNSLLLSQRTSANGKTEPLTGKAIPVAAGIKLRFSFAL
ncbi:MAG: outer membrane beta-barrel protein [Prevotellaceae bacterium]|jgi:hypothetical protein|nr:outer membrane beta-barrel protein [Prevotellaceae bacterium]